MKRYIPNTITCCNLLCGAAAIYFSLGGDFATAFWLIIAAAIFDFLDGFAARMLKAYSAMGVQLDSLADMVSFGVAPAMAVFATIDHPQLRFCALLLAAFAALRLAKFNIDTRQSEEFRGLPTPAMSLFFFSYVTQEVVPHSTLLSLGLVALFCALMVCDLRMFSFKFKTFDFEQNSLRYFFAIFSVIILAVAGYAAPALIIMGYITISFVMLFLKKS
ncbi:CDP-diacylglycerol-serine O-phosphatidyltransferase [Mucinivorans hirudinis]|uniref:CDP-diacylglycerol--serine O-phosphatidyltransferase n=1 Tax=Mucinivorans hirudinis TaxID=1433126 RepID=A0A060RB91_9BACT|nr:CDP-diacylglycerol-serine O-phosphatidyltransferase [Mucinivorans hirudinis]